MVISVKLRLAAADNAKLPTGHGHLVHAWFLDVVRRRDPALAASLHDGRADKPFTVSMLQGGRRVNGGVVAIETGEACQLRVTAVDEATGEVVAGIASGDVDRLVLAGHEFRIEDAAAEERSFAELVDRAVRRDGKRRIGLRLLSPTAFKSDRQRIPFPWPELLVRKLGEKWNVYAPPRLRLHEGDLAVVTSALWIGRYDLRTEVLKFPRRHDSHEHPEVGCVGECEFVVDDRAPAGTCTVARSLIEFAYYVGVGHKTTMGMGQARPMPPLPRS